MKIILTALGSRGDVQPMIALAQRLSARGHQVALLVPSDFEGWIRRLGLAFHDLGVDVQSWLGANVHRLSHHPARIARGLGEFVAEQAYPQFERTAEACRGADMVVVSGLQLAAPSMVDMGASVVRVAL
jgi:vancomycin aglycone glucosyltransferase